MCSRTRLPVRALRDQLKYDALYPDPSKLTVLANNHDTPRFLSLEGADLTGAMLHTAFILSVRGIPQLYYGEEIAMEGKEDPDNRRDFPVSAFRRAGESRKSSEMFEWTQAVDPFAARAFGDPPRAIDRSALRRQRLRVCAAGQH